VLYCLQIVDVGIAGVRIGDNILRFRKEVVITITFDCRTALYIVDIRDAGHMKISMLP
jgi:hypothetical protein